MQKKVMAMLLAVIMALALFSGCGEASPDTSAPASGSAGGETHKIGVIFYGRDDALGSCVYAEINHAAEVIGIEVEWALGDYDTAAQLTSAENLVSAGCEGIMFMPIEDASAQRVGQYCEENGVYFAICFRDILDQDIKAYVESCEYYVGSCWEDDAGAAEEMVAVLAENGRTVYGLEKLNPSIALAVRNDGYAAGTEANNAQIVAEYEVPNDGNSQTHINGITNFLNLYPDMDAILMTTASQGAAEAIMNTLKQNTTPDKIQVVTFDLYEGIAEDFEAGWVAAAAAGNSPDALFVFLMLANSVEGTPLSDTFINLSQKEIIVTSAEECADFEKYIDNPDFQIYSDEIIRSLNGKYNSEVSLQDFTDLMEAFSLDWVKENSV